jgi:hypothetical protein
MTSRCNVRCDGCYYYEGDKQNAQDNVDVEAWRNLFREEKARGITFVVLAGAEPALVPELLEACYGEIPLGAIASNGWFAFPNPSATASTSRCGATMPPRSACASAKRMLERQIEIYAGDPRAVFVYTFTRENIAERAAVVETWPSTAAKSPSTCSRPPSATRVRSRTLRRRWPRRARPCCALLGDFPSRCSSRPTAPPRTPTRFRCTICTRAPTLGKTRAVRPGPLLPAVPLRSDLGARGLVLRARHRLRRLPPLRRGQRHRHRAHEPPHRQPRPIPLLARLRRHLPRGVDPGLRQAPQPVRGPGSPSLACRSEAAR